MAVLIDIRPAMFFFNLVGATLRVARFTLAIIFIPH